MEDGCCPTDATVHKWLGGCCSLWFLFIAFVVINVVV